MSSANVLAFNGENFQSEVLSSSQPVLVDFWAEWCMPCKMLLPTIDAIATEYAGKVKVGKVNIEDEGGREVAVRYGIMNIPTLIVFRDGQMVKKFVGVQSKADLKTALDEVLEG